MTDRDEGLVFFLGIAVLCILGFLALMTYMALTDWNAFVKMLLLLALFVAAVACMPLAYGIGIMTCRCYDAIVKWRDEYGE